ncbi:sulfotransferase domain-containing protein [Aliifodinibius salicampi]|uniref:Sulfotransferase domain-containing protein n=1 Tax=Fodinibius salicampi TaxID=1920655 RepID=A0ABT3PYY8_9BACT|nr:sulfotransferase domain-containing protein [Fodinibius salicampi]MCW9713074.1 sulfotransferase domain-containing protein [Fodinibius salicampi]
MSQSIDFVFIGPQRTGTTWVYKQLKKHQELCFPKNVKETMFFDQHYEKGLEWYYWHFRHKSDKQLLGEIAPTYFDEEKVPERIHSVNVDCKIFITLRNPISRAQSLFHHHLRKGRVDRDFSSSIEDIPRIISAGKYSKHIPRWMNQFGKNDVHVLLLDDIKNEPKDTLRKITNLLDIPTISLDNGIDNKVNPATMPENITIAKYGAILATFLRSKRLHKVVEFGKRLGLKSIFSGREDELPELSEDNKQELLDYYKEDIQFVENLTGRDLGHWYDLI